MLGIAENIPTLFIPTHYANNSWLCHLVCHKDGISRAILFKVSPLHILYPISHLLTGLHQSTFLTCAELFLLQDYQDNNYTATSEPQKKKKKIKIVYRNASFQLHREAAPKHCKPQFPTGSVI